MLLWNALMCIFLGMKAKYLGNKWAFRNGNGPVCAEWTKKTSLGFWHYIITIQKNSRALPHCIVPPPPFFITKCIQLENPCWLTKPEEQHQSALTEPHSGLLGGLGCFKSSIIGRISPPSIHSESAMGLLLCQDDTTQITAGHNMSNTRYWSFRHILREKVVRPDFWAVNCLQIAPPPPLLRVLSDVLVWK